MRTDADHLPRVREPAVQMLLSHAGQYDARLVAPVADPQLLTISPGDEAPSPRQKFPVSELGEIGWISAENLGRAEKIPATTFD